MSDYAGFTSAAWQEVTEEIGARLQETREARGLSTGEVAAAAGLDVAEYERWERGGADGPRVNPYLRDFIRTTLALGTTLTTMFDMPELEPIEQWPDTMTSHGFLEDERDVFSGTEAVSDEWWLLYTVALGARFRIRRFRLKVSMAMLSEMTGLDKEYIAHIETGKASPPHPASEGAMPSLLTIATMARALRTALVDLLPVNPRVYDELDRRDTD